jgi:hypothetical protein
VIQLRKKLFQWRKETVFINKKLEDEAQRRLLSMEKCLNG